MGISAGGPGGVMQKIGDIHVGLPGGGLAAIREVWNYESGLWVRRWAKLVPDAITTVFSAAGSYTYSPPTGCTYLVIVAIGGGGGGADADNDDTNGQGGGAGAWASRVIEGPFGNPEYPIVVGAAGVNSGADGTAGAASTFRSPTNLLLLSAAGGTAGTNNDTNIAGRRGAAAGNHVFRGVTYTGGGEQSLGTGNAPGGGGSGGNGNNGRAGAAGRVWVTAHFEPYTP